MGCRSVAVVAERDREIVIRDVVLTAPATVPPDHVVVRAATVAIPRAAFQDLVAAATSRTGLRVDGDLRSGELVARVSVALLKITVAFRPAAVEGRVILQPSGGLPGWLMGRAAASLSRVDGVMMDDRGTIRVDPARLIPPSVTLLSGISDINVTGDAIIVRIGPAPNGGNIQ